MPRHARVLVPGVPLHVRQRGIDRRPCFATDSDRELYLGLLAELTRAHGCAMHAYVLMPNHVHLLFTASVCAEVAFFMKDLGQRYTQYFNRTHRRVGPLWDGRFRSSLVDSSSYVLTCLRYIELNPVRAKIAASPVSFEWSSFATNAMGAPSTFIVPHPTYLALGDSGHERQCRYLDFVAASTSGEELAAIRSAINANAALGPPEFVEEMERLSGRPAKAIPRGRPRTPELQGCEGSLLPS